MAATRIWISSNHRKRLKSKLNEILGKSTRNNARLSMRKGFGSLNILISSHDLHIQDCHFIGIAPWRLISEMPRHNTIHQSIYETGISHGLLISYLGLSNHQPVSWIKQVLPDSILKPFPVIKSKYYKLISDSLLLTSDKTNIIYIYEGSFSWAILIKLLSLEIVPTNVVCNLFPASKYENLMFKSHKMKLRYKLMFWIISKSNRIQITVDTKHLKEKINSIISVNPKVEVFPLPSSFDLLVGQKPKHGEHSKVLVNLRDFPFSDLTNLLEGSCRLCSFVFASGLSEQAVTSYGLLDYQNVKFEERSIAVEDYRYYIDTFDYMIFLYKPSLDSSGKILDCITRKIPICLPKEATEWVENAMDWNKTFLFEFGNTHSAKSAFNHPIFSEPLKLGDPLCTAINTLQTFSSYNFPPTERNLSPYMLKVLMNLHYLAVLSLGKVFSLRKRLSNYV